MEKLKEQFFQDCWASNQVGVRDCLARGVDVNTHTQHDGYGFWSGLTIAAHENYLELLEILLSQPQIKINNITPDGDTALIVACEAGNSAILTRLLQVPGLDVNLQNKWYGHTAANMACCRGATKIVRILAETGRVDWNQGDKWDRTPLFWALSCGNSDIVDIIVKQPNIDYNATTEDGETLTHAAVRRGEVKCLEILAAQKKCDCWNIPFSNGDTPIMAALKDGYGDTAVAKILLSCPRVDLSCKDRKGWHLFVRAIQKNKLGTTTTTMILLDSVYP